MISREGGGGEGTLDESVGSVLENPKPRDPSKHMESPITCLHIPAQHPAML